VPDTINITSANFMNGGFDINWEKSINGDFYQYDLYHSVSETIDDSLMIYTTNNINNTNFFMESGDPLIFNYFYIIVSDTFSYVTKGNIYTSSLDPKPIAIQVESVSYDNNSMDIFWTRSIDTDFSKYELYMGSDTINPSLIETFNDQSITTHGLSEFDPHINNYFRIIVYDTLGQFSKGNFLSNNVQPIPEAVDLDPIEAFGNEFSIIWSPYPTADFKRYNLYQAYNINMDDKEIIFTTTNRTENSYFSIDNDYEIDYYFQVSMIDDWGYETFSNIEFIDPEYFTFVHHYDSGSEIDIGFYGIQTSSGKYKIIAETSLDVVMVSTDRYGADSSFYSYNYEATESPVELIQTDDQGFVFISNIVHNAGDTDIRITKTDQYGGSIWNTVYGYIDPYDPDNENASYGNDFVNDISLTADGGYIVTGRYHAEHSDILILKLNSQGEIENEHHISTAPSYERIAEDGHAILETIDNNYIILGSLSEFESTGPSNIWLAQFDPNLSTMGEILWSSTWDINEYDYPKNIITNQDGGYTISGYSSNNNSGDNGSSWIIKTDMSGNGEVLQPFTGENFAYSMIEIDAGDYILAGKKIEGSNSQGWIVSIDSDGNQNWERLYGNEDIEAFYSVQQTNDRGFILTGVSHLNGASDILHVKTDPNGNVLSDE